MYLVFHRNSDNFKDVLLDPIIKKSIRTKISFSNHLILEFDTEKNTSYAIIKYGDDIIRMSDIIPDRTPIMNVDYIPDKKK